LSNIQLILLRHGEAGYNAHSDFERSLSFRGREQLNSQFQHWQSMLEGVDKVLCSPYLRTRQTAELAMGFCPQAYLAEDDRLVPEGDVTAANAAIEANWSERLLVVTHQPLIGYLVSYYRHGHLQLPEPLMPGQGVCLEMPWPGPDCGQVKSS